MKEVYVRRINEVLDAEGNVEPTQTYYTEELYTAQSVDDTGEETDSEGRTIRWSYEQNGTGDFALYIANATSYDPISYTKLILTEQQSEMMMSIQSTLRQQAHLRNM